MNFSIGVFWVWYQLKFYFNQDNWEKEKIRVREREDEERQRVEILKRMCLEGA